MLLFTCKSDRPGKSTGVYNNQETGEIIEKIEDIKKVYNLCPSPAEMLSAIEIAKMQFRADLLNPVSGKGKYLDMRSLNLNLGIYLTDLAYSAIFGRREETIGYLEVVREIGEKIRITGAVNEYLMDRAKDNVNYIDSLFNISNEAFINMIFFCEQNDRPSTIMLISTGAFIESLYLSGSMVGEYKADDPVIMHLADQKYVLDNLLASAETDAVDPNVAYAIELLKPLSVVYDQIRTSGSRTVVQKEGPGRLIIRGKNNNLQEQNFIMLRETVTSIRNNIVLNNIQ